MLFAVNDNNTIFNPMISLLAFRNALKGCVPFCSKNRIT